MADVLNVGRTNDQDIDGLLSGVMWDNVGLVDSLTGITYSFPTSSSFYEAGYGWGQPNIGFEALNPTQKAAVNTIVDMYASVTGLSINRMTESATDHADLRLAMTDDVDEDPSITGTTAWGYYPSTAPEGGDSWYKNNGGEDYDNPVRGNYAYHTFIHEIGHALGLKHGHETDVFGAMTAAHDSMEYSVMTYRSYVNDPLVGGYSNETWGYAQTPMMYDIAALQHMYGADFTTNAGNSTYRWDPATGETFINDVGQGAPGGNRVFMTVWDGGGTDTYDLSAYATAVTIDLFPGEWTTTSAAQLADLGDGHDARGNVANALLFDGDTRSLIENAIGGSASDSILGNRAANTLDGRAGNDTISGRDGKDVIDGGTGVDRMTGGTGSDIFDFDAAGETGGPFLTPTLRTVTYPSVDVITDFKHLTDFIDVSTIDASPQLAGNNAFNWLGTGAFGAGARGELRYAKFDNAGTTNDYTVVYGDTDDDTSSEFQIELLGLVDPSAQDFYL